MSHGRVGDSPSVLTEGWPPRVVSKVTLSIIRFKFVERDGYAVRFVFVGSVSEALPVVFLWRLVDFVDVFWVNVLYPECKIRIGW